MEPSWSRADKIGALLGILILIGMAMGIPDSRQTAALILAPGIGASYTFGERMDIKWRGGDASAVAAITLIDEQGQRAFRTLLDGMPNDGEEPWYVDVPPGQYKLNIHICPACTGGSVWIQSLQTFTVTEGATTRLPAQAMDTPANRSLIIFYPANGQTLHAGVVETIRWYGGEENWHLSLKLLESSDLGLQEVIGENIPHTSWFAWTVPSIVDNTSYYLSIECTNCGLGTFGTRALTWYPVTIRNP